tara:strand:- start:702 stop:932 length:231 start_codon:yes stop_codon:yes gene_type:complete
MAKTDERKFIVQGKEYKESELPAQVVNWILCKTDAIQTKQRHIVELEKIEVLCKYYDEQVLKYFKDKNGSDSKSKS